MTLARLFLAIVAALFLSGAPPVPAEAKVTSPDQFIADLGNGVIRTITDDTTPVPEKEQSFRRLFNEAFDTEELVKFVLGRHWRTATDEQRKEFRQLFEDLTVKTYSSRFSQYSGEQFVVKDAKPAPEQGEHFVPSAIERPNGPPLRIDWRVRKNGDGWRITDIIVEGVSMALTYRQEYASYIQKNDGKVQALIDRMRSKVAEH